MKFTDSVKIYSWIVEHVECVITICQFLLDVSAPLNASGSSEFEERSCTMKRPKFVG
jgi:hypothetical protein